ncbi:LysR family transcriptional regulator [Mesorhizobium sp. B1-1-5]|uniref:LysR family transcriptional regulator n=1 Tax=Mesorhizobium sp. B1-1-5 TaxID=2589979 RepID=UPI00112AE77D|nr:LysR family transcriptional regulator [Mesorhizobium sp. B1-1-5]TPO05659.1 LysR family transcriptional regulator [Mesorhizobium sp. B1-1-5]
MNLSSFDLNLLRVLDALLREQSTVKAGERIGLSQPAISASLGRLRNFLGDPLFVRQGQHIVPTQYARNLELPLRRILDELSALLGGPGSFNPAEAEQSFKIAGSDFFAEMLMPALANAISRHAPKILVQLVDLVPDDYVGTLEKHGIDLALVPRVDFPSWIDYLPAFRSTFVTIARAGHPRLERAKVSPGDVIPIDLFCDLGHVVFSPEGKLKAMGDAALARMGRERRVAMTMPVFGGVCNAVAGSDLVALVPEQLARKVASRLGLAIYSPPMPIDPALICIVWHKRNTTDPTHRWLREMVLELLSQLSAGEAGSSAHEPRPA